MRERVSIIPVGALNTIDQRLCGWAQICALNATTTCYKERKRWPLERR